MSSQTPSVPDNAPGKETPDDDIPVDDQSKGPAMHRSWRPIAAALIALVIAAGVAGALLFTGEDDKPKEQAAPAKGLACPYLQQASDAYDRGDNAAFDKALKEAVKVAERTLQTSGELFGKPERIALELGLQPVDDPGRLLHSAQAICSELGLTPAR